MAKSKKNDDYVVSVLSYKRLNNCSNALLYESNGDNELTPIKVREISVRGPMETRQENPNKQNKRNKDPKNPNLQRIDIASLSKDKNTLVMQFNLQIVSTPKPFNCDNPEARIGLEQLHQEFITDGVYDEVARRIAINIANARYLWRNREGCDSISVYIKDKTPSKDPMQEYEFDAFDFSLNTFDLKGVPQEYRDQINSLSQKIADVYKGNRPYFNITVEAWAKKFPGIEVYPSQEIPGNQAAVKKGDKSKFLFKVKEDQAALHPQKVTNALLCIDDWYNDADKPIPVNVYGSISQDGEVNRPPSSKTDFYNLFDKAKYEKCINPDEQTGLTVDQKLFVASMLIRGGVFGEAGDKE